MKWGSVFFFLVLWSFWSIFLNFEYFSEFWVFFFTIFLNFENVSEFPSYDPAFFRLCLFNLIRLEPREAILGSVYCCMDQSVGVWQTKALLSKSICSGRTSSTRAAYTASTEPKRRREKRFDGWFVLFRASNFPIFRNLTCWFADLRFFHLQTPGLRPNTSYISMQQGLRSNKQSFVSIHRSTLIICFAW